MLLAIDNLKKVDILQACLASTVPQISPKVNVPIESTLLGVNDHKHGICDFVKNVKTIQAGVPINNSMFPYL